MTHEAVTGSPVELTARSASPTLVQGEVFSMATTDGGNFEGQVDAPEPFLTIPEVLRQVGSTDVVRNDARLTALYGFVQATSVERPPEQWTMGDLQETAVRSVRILFEDEFSTPVVSAAAPLNQAVEVLVVKKGGNLLEFKQNVADEIGRGVLDAASVEADLSLMLRVGSITRSQYERALRKVWLHEEASLREKAAQSSEVIAKSPNVAVSSSGDAAPSSESTKVPPDVVYPQIAQETGQVIRKTVNAILDPSVDAKQEVTEAIAALPNQLGRLYGEGVAYAEDVISANRQILEQHGGEEVNYFLSLMLPDGGRNIDNGVISDILSHTIYAEPTSGVPIMLLDAEGMSLLQAQGGLRENTSGSFFRFKTRQGYVQFIVAELPHDKTQETQHDAAKKLETSQVIRHETQHFVWSILESSDFARKPDAADPKMQKAFQDFRHEIGARIVDESSVIGEENPQDLVYSDDPALQKQAAEMSSFVSDCIKAGQEKGLDPYTFLFPVLTARNFDEMRQNLLALTQEVPAIAATEVGGEKMTSTKEAEDRRIAKHKAYKQGGVEALAEVREQEGFEEVKAPKKIEEYALRLTTEAEWTAFLAAKTLFDRDPLLRGVSQRLFDLNDSGMLNYSTVRTALEDVKNTILAVERDPTFDRGRAGELLRRADELTLLFPAPTEAGRNKDAIERYGALVVALNDEGVMKPILDVRGSAAAIPAEITASREKLKQYLGEEGFKEEKIKEILGERGTMGAPDVAPAKLALWDRLVAPGATAADIASRNAAANEILHELRMIIAGKLNPAEMIVGIQIKALLDSFNPTDTEPLEKLMIRVISIPTREPMHQYHLGFYPQNNLDSIKQVLVDHVEEQHEKAEELHHTHSPQYAEEHRKLLEVEGFHERMLATTETVSQMHNMSWALLTNQIDQFPQAARTLANKNIDIMMQYAGVAEYYRIISEEFRRVLARDGRISFVPTKDLPLEKGNYGELFGYLKKERDPATGKMKDVMVEGSIRKLFRSVNESGVLGEQLEDYQVPWAGAVAEYMYNMFLRSSEMVSIGMLPNDEAYGDQKDDQGMIARLPHNQIATAMDIWKNTISRWAVGETSGGPFLMEMTFDRYEQEREDYGWDIPLLARMMRLKVSDIEHSGMMAFVGYWRSWRSDQAIVRTAPFWNPELPNEQTNIRSYIDDSVHGMRKHVNVAGISTTERANRLRALWLTGTGQLKPQFNNTLALLLNESSITPDETTKQKYGQEYEAAKLEIRAAIFHRVAEENPIVLADFLNGARIVTAAELDELMRKTYKGKNKKEKARLIAKKHADLRRLRGFNGVDLYDPVGNSVEYKAWNGDPAANEIGLRQKLVLANEIRMRLMEKACEVNNPNIQLTLNQILGIDPLPFIGPPLPRDSIRLTPVEAALLQTIREEGNKVAYEFGTVRHNQMQFDNDISYKRVNFSSQGDAAFSDAMTGDVTKLYQAGQALVDALSQPSGVEPEDMFKKFQAMVDALGEVYGTSSGQNKLYSLAISYLKYIELGSNAMLDGHDGPTIWSTWDIITHFRKTGQLPNSLAQEFGSGAPAVNLEGLEKDVKLLFRMHVFRKAQYDSENVRNTHVPLNRWFKNVLYGSKPADLLRWAHVPVPKPHKSMDFTAADLYNKARKELGVQYFTQRKWKDLIMNLILTVLLPALGGETLKESGKGAV